MSVEGCKKYLQTLSIHYGNKLRLWTVLLRFPYILYTRYYQKSSPVPVIVGSSFKIKVVYSIQHLLDKLSIYKSRLFIYLSWYIMVINLQYGIKLDVSVEISAGPFSILFWHNFTFFYIRSSLFFSHLETLT